MSTKDALGEQNHVWIKIIENPMMKPKWPAVPVRVNDYLAVLPRGQKILVSEPLVANLRYARDCGRNQLQFSEMGILDPDQAHAVRLQDQTIVYPRTCATPTHHQKNASRKGK